MNKYSICACICTLLLPAPEVLAERHSQGTVVLTGWLHVFDLSMTDVTVEVIVNGTGRKVSVSQNGRFTLELPAETEALLRFDKPGHEPKEVRVDTHNAIPVTGVKRPHVKFAVILHLKRHMGGLGFSGPVGTIAFAPQGRDLLVHHTCELVPQEMIMEF